jgi:hypothetical protein
MKIPFFQSFQTGRSFRKGDPHAAAWKYLKRIGTLDNLQRVSSATSTPTTVANIACLRIRQAIELYDASLNTSTLTRPLLLYYCALNLVRGALLARHGETSSASHGMTYIAGSDLLDSKAKMSKNGTFPRLIESIWGGHTENTNSQSLTLLEILAQIPELRHEFHLIGITEPPIAEVHVEAFSNAETNLKYFIPNIDPKEFSENWQTFLSWMSDKCRYSSDMTFTLLDNLNDAEKIKNFCNQHLWRDLQWREKCSLV